jgi:hypothetical protein
MMIFMTIFQDLPWSLLQSLPGFPRARLASLGPD